MNKRNWLIPVLIVAINALAIIVRWGSLPELLPAHFDLKGNADGEMRRGVLLLYPLISAVISLIFYLIARIKNRLNTAFVIAASGIGLVLLSSTMVTLTSGTLPFFMLVEPVILLITFVAFVVSVLKSRK